jgi:hypothetical protein
VVGSSINGKILVRKKAQSSAAGMGRFSLFIRPKHDFGQSLENGKPLMPLPGLIAGTRAAFLQYMAVFSVRLNEF